MFWLGIKLYYLETGGCDLELVLTGNLSNDVRHDYNDRLNNDTNDVQIATSFKTIKIGGKNSSPAVIWKIKCV